MNIGALAGGIAKGWSQGIRDSSIDADRKIREKQQERIDKKNADEDAMEAELKALEASYAQPAPAGATPADASGSPAVPSSAGQAPSPQPINTGGSVIADVLGKAQAQVNIRAKYGKDVTTEMVSLANMVQQVEKEGGKDAIAAFHSGDIDRGLKVLNSTGQHRDWQVVNASKGVENIAGNEMPTSVVTLRNANGDTRTINTARDGFALMSVEKQIDAMSRAQQLKQAADHQNATLSEQSRHNIATEGIATSRAQSAGVGGSKGKWVQDEDGQWQFLKTDESTQGMVKEQVKFNDDGTTTAYDPVSGTARTVYTPEQADSVARSRAEAESERAGKGLFSLEWGEQKISARAAEIKKELLEQSKRPPKGDPSGAGAPAGPAGGIGKTSDNNVGNMKNPGGKSGFQQFDSPEAALSSMDKQLTIYDGRGIDTIDKIVSTYSPASDGNNTKALIAEAERVTGFKSGQRIDLSNPAARARVVAALLKQEKPASSLLKKEGGGGKEVAATGEEPASEQANPAASVAKGGIKKSEDGKKWYDGSIDVGAAVGKPMAAVGEAAGKSVAGAIDALATIKKDLTDAEYQKALAYSQAENVDIGPMIAELGAAGFKAWLSSANPAKNTDAYMSRTSPKNMNQYFR